MKFSYWSKFHVNIITGCGVMTKTKAEKLLISIRIWLSFTYKGILFVGLPQHAYDFSNSSLTLTICLKHQRGYFEKFDVFSHVVTLVVVVF